ncbi:tannase/feruloyl esterase family alpha/beta hydrolase [Dyadobacter pollutisoli]|uniref:Tannase/feruloyl esterase family alpha/beta hydrolase n=1 Tax=Dyadobacter pollutisoli TaxID=2910158 RepID=A0A9E8N643_9BACT|nr:tannase/feruloyl esterase family alpha/beta hydrolase [Dyadobacter pollutisoli]WAC09262.1 tannase/feruloyl esterase family alpha/beta hydrolase [Dyadobacter pollutisoli]
MRKFYISFALMLFARLAVAQHVKPCKPCEELKKLQLPDVTIVVAEANAGDTISNRDEPWRGTVVIKKPFCRILGRISKEINFELLLPEESNTRFLMSGGGGFVGTIQNDFQRKVDEGFATAGTDTGHQGGEDAKWAYNNMERQLNFGRLAIHRTAVVSKAIMQNYYCAAASKSYFVGCSRGGGQAMVEAQYYPEDFDGIVAGAPAFAWPAIAAKFLQHSQYNYPDPKKLSPVVTKDNLKLLQKEVLRQCDQLDGSVDGIINNPGKCKLDFSKLPLCANEKPGSVCFTKAQMAAIRAIYSPLVANGKQIYPGFPFGGEAEDNSWDPWITAPISSAQKEPSLHHMFSTNIFKYLIFNDSTFSYSNYNFKNFTTETAYASSYLDATNTDYSEFKKRNGKIIFFHGWNDAALSANATIEHYNGILKSDKDAESYARLFLLPGVLHCGGGPGCDNVDWVSLIIDWVEKSKAPDQIVASKEAGGKTITKHIFPYPKE